MTEQQITDLHEVAGRLLGEAQRAASGRAAETIVSGSVQRSVEMPAGARKEVTLYLQPEAFQRQVTIQFQEPNGTVKAIVETRVLEQASSQFAIVGDGAGTLRPQLSTGDGVGVPAPLCRSAPSRSKGCRPSCGPMTAPASRRRNAAASSVGSRTADSSSSSAGRIGRRVRQASPRCSRSMG